MNLITKKSDARGALRSAGWKDKDILDVIPLEIPYPIPATSEHDKTCICMYCKPELWPNDSEENKYRDLAAERWNQLEEERKRLDWLEENADINAANLLLTSHDLRENIDAAMKREET